MRGTSGPLAGRKLLAGAGLVRAEIGIGPRRGKQQRPQQEECPPCTGQPARCPPQDAVHRAPFGGLPQMAHSTLLPRGTDTRIGT